VKDLIGILAEMDASDFDELVALWRSHREQWRARFDPQTFRALQQHGLGIGKRLLRQGRLVA
jgi:hypothetical protein